MPASTFSDLLASRLARDAAQPLVTFYDDATGERVELSTATYANWVAKTAGLLQDELDLEPGGTVLVDLPTHWLGAVWLGAAWTVGTRVTDDPARLSDVDAVVCGPALPEEYVARAGRIPVVALSLLPLGARFTEPLPSAVTDYGAVVLAEPDVFAPLRPVLPEDDAWLDADGTISQGRLLEDAATSTVVTRRGRLLTDLAPCSRPGLLTLVGPLMLDAATVWVRHPDPGAWSHRAATEHVTDELRSGQPPRS